MKDYVVRMVEEHKELNERIAKLHDTLENKDFLDGIGREKASLLSCQYAAMETYGAILANRLLIELEEENLTLEDLE